MGRKANEDQTIDQLVDQLKADVPTEVTLVEHLPIDPNDDLSGVEGEASPRLESVVESLLFASNRPLTVKAIRRVLPDASTQQIQLALKSLISRREEDRTGVFVAQVAGGFILQTKAQNATWIQRMLKARPVRLSRPQLETLAIIAYRQPVTRAELDHVRGVDSDAVLRVLLERDLVKIVGKKEEPGRPMLFGTTVKFLEFFNLMSLRDMPDLREFRELSEGTKEMLQQKLGFDEDEAEVLGQEVLDFAASELERRATGPDEDENAVSDQEIPTDSEEPSDGTGE